MRTRKAPSLGAMMPSDEEVERVSLLPAIELPENNAAPVKPGVIGEALKEMVAGWEKRDDLIGPTVEVEKSTVSPDGRIEATFRVFGLALVPDGPNRERLAAWAGDCNCSECGKPLAACVC